MSLKVKWPLVVTCSIANRGVKIFNMENLSLIHCIDVESLCDLNIINNILIVAGVVKNQNSQAYRALGHMFWNLTELIDDHKTDKKDVPLARFIWNAEISVSVAIHCYERLF